MLMVIFGAGASYDSVSSFRPGATRERVEEKFRPPLANELFHRVDEFRGLLSDFPRCREILNRLEPSPDGIALVEERLEELQAEGEAYPVRQRQLLSVRYYLQKLISQCEDHWIRQNHDYTNYVPLLDYIRRQGPACLVTFNYDTMIEKAFKVSGRSFNTIDDYILDLHYPLFKPHGSTDWENRVEGIFQSARPSPDDLIENAESLRPMPKIRMRGEGKDPPPPAPHSVWIPALAVPVVTKSDFMCPLAHLQKLREEIPKVTKLLVIGWRATEQHFLDLLSKGITRAVQVMAVCGTSDEAGKTLHQLKSKGVHGELVPFTGGFSDFIQSAQINQFLAVRQS